MADLGPIEDMSRGELLDRLDVLHRQQLEAEVEILALAGQWAVMHGQEVVDPAIAALPGREHARRFGGEGTPEVAEFAAAEFGARIRRSPAAARELIADALDLMHRCPRVWERVERLEVRVSYARFVVKRCRDLSREQAAYVDGRVVEAADGRISWSRFEALVDGAIAAADVAAARAREETAAAATFAKRTRGDKHGMATFMVRADVATIEAIDGAVTAEAARIEGPSESADERRVEAVLHLVTGTDPGQTERALPRVQLYVHTYGHADGTGIARIEGHGAVTEDYLRRVLGPRARFRVTPVLDIEGQAPVDAYEIPDKHRQAVHLLAPADVFPFAGNTGRTMEIDHTTPYDAAGPPGQSRVGNYGPMTRLHHRIKTFGRWTARQPFPGVYVWRDQYGALYLVDHSGTRRLPAAA